MNTQKAPIEHIVVCGDGLAASMTVAALSRQLPPRHAITLIRRPSATDTDLLYGNIATPTAYEFNLLAGVTEPQVVLASDTAFSWGTSYNGWGGSWVQSFHLALPTPEGVLLHHYLTRRRIERLEAFLISAVAARAGAFAHPPQRPDQPLSRAEYGYQLDPRSYAGLFAAGIDKARVRTIDAQIADVDRDEQGVKAIRLADGQSISGDFYIDCTGPEALLLSRLGGTFTGNRRVRAAASRTATDKLGPPSRIVTAADFGWRADTALQGGSLRLTLCDPDSESAALASHAAPPQRTCEATLGQRAHAWSGNCVAIGQAASVVEPITPAPLLLLQRDIERLLGLIPVSQDMSVERREFNRQYADDYFHAGLFNRALFETRGLPEGSYWRAAREEPVHEKLARKIEMFESRGLLVAYDLEPFNQEDWTILHFGMRRLPTRYDRIADRAPEPQVRQYLENMQREIEMAVKALPSHDAYMAGLIRFLKQRKA